VIRGAFAPFSSVNFRNLWMSDALSLWGFEMETLVLAWYVLVQTDSALMVSVVAALRFGGTLISPWLGVYVDRLSKRSVMLAMRVVFLVVALGILLALSFGELEVWQALFAAGVSGLMRPPEMVVRQALIAESVPSAELVNAIGFARMTMDGSRIVGALSGASAMALLGVDAAYAIVGAMYFGALLFTLRLQPVAPTLAANAAKRAFDELKAGINHILDSPWLRRVMWLAVIANLTAYPLMHGLLPVIARQSFGLDEVGLANMVASVSAGALLGSVLISFARGFNAKTAMVGGLLVWHAALLMFALSETLVLANILLFACGLASSFGMVAMSAVLLAHAHPSFRGRVMGVRMLCVYALPVGLVVAGALIEYVGVQSTLVAASLIGFGLVLLNSRALQ
jgi:MFS family permease